MYCKVRRRQQAVQTQTYKRTGTIIPPCNYTINLQITRGITGKVILLGRSMYTLNHKVAHSSCHTLLVVVMRLLSSPLITQLPARSVRQASMRSFASHMSLIRKHKNVPVYESHAHVSLQLQKQTPMILLQLAGRATSALALTCAESVSSHVTPILNG